MLNINELETRWLHYKLKSLIPSFVISISLIIIIFTLVFFDFSKLTKTSHDNAEQIQKNIPSKMPINTFEINSTKEVKIVPADNFVKKPVKNLEKKQKEKLSIKPSLGFMDNIREDTPRYYNSYKAPKVTLKKKEVKKIAKKKAPKKIITPVIEEVILDTKVEDTKKVKEIQIQRQDTQDDIKHVIKRFKKSNNPALSLFIAKKYYELGNYNESYNYSLTTNEINNDIEDSWMIFSKSLYKLGKKDKAIEVLKKYIISSHSHRAKILLDNIKAGKIK